MEEGESFINGGGAMFDKMKNNEFQSKSVDRHINLNLIDRCDHGNKEAHSTPVGDAIKEQNLVCDWP